MSGLFGYFSQRTAHNAPQVAARIGERLRHHAHYQVDVAAAGSSGALGRVGIGLLNSAPQPILSPDGTVVIALCGEFYHQEHDSDDAGLALHTYLTGGTEALAALEGMFIIAVWDERSGDFSIVNDRFGLYPHYYAHYGGCLTFAPEIKGVLAAPGVPRTLDLTAVAQYTRFQQLLGERTWLEDVHLLPPATILTYSPAQDRLTLTRYWDWDQIPLQPEDITLDEATDETIRLSQRAIDAMTRDPLRVGIFLSGGLDSRMILGFTRDRLPVSTFTFGHPNSRDVHVAAQLARRSGSDHHFYPMHDGRWVLDHTDEHLRLTEGMHSWMHAHGMNILSDASQFADVNLSGWDGGTVLGGFIASHGYDERYRNAPDEGTMAAHLFEGFCREFAWPGLTDTEAGELYSPPGNPELRGLAYDSFVAELARTAHYPEPNRADYFYILQHCRRSTQNMVVFARSRLEVRCPFFDYELVSFLYGLPPRLRRSFDLQYLVLTRRMPDLARIPNEKDNLPPHASRALRTAHRVARKARHTINRVTPLFPERPRLYADYENYLRAELANWARDILLDQRTLDRGLFNPAAVHNLWDRHQRGDELWTIGKVAPLITLELVLRQFIDDEETAIAPPRLKTDALQPL